ncbi:MAG: Trp family transcriptional regulator [Actinomycetota bacterium]
MANTNNHALLSDDRILELYILLCEEICLADTPGQVAELLCRLLTPQELRMVAIRLEVRRMLCGGATYAEISNSLAVSNDTISRIRLSLEHTGLRPRQTHSLAENNPIGESLIFNPKAINESHTSLLNKYPQYFWPAQILANIVRASSKKSST